MESLTSKEFFEQLKSNSLKQPFLIKGFVKKAEKDSEVLFKKKGGNSSHWITIGSSMIETVRVIKTFIKEGELLALVKLQLKTPGTPEGKVLSELLASSEKCNAENKCTCGSKEEHSGYYCKCGCYHGHNCKCGCQREQYEECSSKDTCKK